MDRVRRRPTPALTALAGATVLGLGGVVVASADTTPAANEAAAQQDAAALLGDLQLPAGATRSSTDPSGGSLGAPGTGMPATPNLVDEHQWWVVPAAAGAVMSYVHAHEPAGSTFAASAGPDTAGQSYPNAVAYGLAPEDGVLSQLLATARVTG